MQNNKTAIITGAAGLLGYEHAIVLADAGYNIVILDINLKILKQKAKLLDSNKKKDVKILFFKCDITSEKQVRLINKKIIDKKLKIEVLVNNADKNPKMKKYKNSFTGRVEDYSISKLKNELNVGLIGTFICCKIFGNQMKKNKKGSIINIASDLGIKAPDQRVYDKKMNIFNVKNFKPIGYSISKHGIIGITRYLATYWARYGVRSNNLIPGGVFNNQPKFLVKNYKFTVPMNRWAKKSEYRSAIKFLATDDSAYMTGQSLIIDGGRTVW